MKLMENQYEMHAFHNVLGNRIHQSAHSEVKVFANAISDT